MRATYPMLHKRCVTERPDVVCYDATNWPARIVAGKLGIPAVRCVPNLASNATYSLDAQLTTGLGADHPALAALAADCAQFSAEHGVELDFAGTMDVTEALNLVFLPREFQPAGDSFDERFHFLGPLLGNREETEPWSPLDPRAEVLFISLGTIFTDHPKFYRTCIEAFGDGSWQVVMAVGKVDIAALGPVPSTVDIRPRFPQPAVLRHAAAFISHSGMNSTMEALYYGVPLITFPQMPEQVANAYRVQELGLGERLDAGTITAEALRAAVIRVASNPRVKANLDRMRKAIRHSGGQPAARTRSRSTSATVVAVVDHEAPSRHQQRLKCPGPCAAPHWPRRNSSLASALGHICHNVTYRIDASTRTCTTSAPARSRPVCSVAFTMSRSAAASFGPTPGW
jgi:MGT family glycosyltransferase